MFNQHIEYPTKLFIAWRAVFGVYLAYYAIRMIPYAEEIYGKAGMISDIHYNWTSGIFPAAVLLSSSTAFLVGIHILIASAGCLLVVGVWPRASAIVIWYLQTSLFHRNNLTEDPSMAFVGLLLLTLSLIPYQPKLFSKTKNMEIPFLVFFSPIFVFCLTFTISALDKLASTSWFNGTAFMQMLHLGIARDSLLVGSLVGHPLLAMILSYLAIFTQLVCLPLFLVGRYRWALAINFISFSLMFVLFELNQVIYGMLLFYGFFLLESSEKIASDARTVYKYILRYLFVIAREAFSQKPYSSS